MYVKAVNSIKEVGEILKLSDILLSNAVKLIVFSILMYTRTWQTKWLHIVGYDEPKPAKTDERCSNNYFKSKCFSNHQFPNLDYSNLKNKQLLNFRFSKVIPVTFMTGFYVANVVSRYWDQFLSLPWPDRLAYKLVSYVPGQVKNEYNKTKLKSNFIFL